jgi:phosphoglycerate dehydrogenase-like enzyme
VASIPIAEFVVRSVLEAYQQPQRWVEVRARRAWDHHLLREIFGTTWLVYGFGAIGTEITRRVQAFGAEVVGCRRHPDGTEIADRTITPDQFIQAIAACDVVVLAAPATDETYHVMDAVALSSMNDGSVLVNVARGSLIDEQALRAALDVGRPALAVLDAAQTEPPEPHSWLWDHPNVVLTPHNAFAGEGCAARNTQLFGENLVRFVEGRPLLHEHGGF